VYETAVAGNRRRRRRRRRRRENENGREMKRGRADVT
jgi:hypothetical protein